MSDEGEAWRYRVHQLTAQGRFAEAESACGELLRSDPDDDEVLHLLAFCQYRQEGSEPRALETIDRAIALTPDAALHHALRARVLVTLRRSREAIEAADEAIRLDPDEADGYEAKGWALFRDERWADAEQQARAALELEPDSGPAAFLLAETLRLQGHEDGNREAIGVHLARDPLDPVAHVSAGWAALQRGDRSAAEQHFLEALRLDPRMEMARHGLLESFKSRAPWYRAWLRLNLWAARFSRGSRWAVILGLWALVRFARVVFTGPLAPVGTLLTVLWLALALWSHLASGTAHAIVLLDPRARHALRRPEWFEAAFVGGGVFVGLALALASLVPVLRPLGPLGLGLFGAAIPFAHTFTNASSKGRLLFGSIGGLAILAGLVAAAAVAAPDVVPGSLATALGVAAIACVVLTTWIASAPALNR